MMLWGDLEGRDLEGHWLLGRLARPLGRTAWFEAMGADGMPLMLSITEALNDEDELLARLAAAAEIQHPNVVAIREAGISRLDDMPVVVAAMEMTEENLADVLRERTLSAAEGRQVLDAVLAALTAMHARGLVHRHMDAASILAMDETIKVRSDCVQIGGSGFGVAAADDVRCAARMVTQAVTGFFPKGENDPVLQLLPEPMARAVRRALTGNAGATEVAALAGTRLELMRDIVRDLTRIEPLSKTLLKVAGASEGVGAKEKTAVEEPAGAARIDWGGQANREEERVQREWLVAADAADEACGCSRAGGVVCGAVHAAQRAAAGRRCVGDGGREPRRGAVAGRALCDCRGNRGVAGDGVHVVWHDASGVFRETNGRACDGAGCRRGVAGHEGCDRERRGGEFDSQCCGQRKGRRMASDRLHLRS